ncbi:hypothetical protein [Saccharopolyspora shandongensis]|uniref:hypothetical protein n=1 Tax=Saccharopolyspora shandongensis TaxID=418495 RepID=UPI0033F36C68
MAASGVLLARFTSTGDRSMLRTMCRAPAVEALVVALAVACSPPPPPPAVALPLRAGGEVELSGSGSRFDYASLDSDRGLLFVAHLGACNCRGRRSRAPRGARDPNVPQVHGVLVVPAQGPAEGAVTRPCWNENPSADQDIALCTEAALRSFAAPVQWSFAFCCGIGVAPQFILHGGSLRLLFTRSRFPDV